MDALEFIKARDRLCKQNMGDCLAGCPLQGYDCNLCVSYTDEELKTIVEVVEKWAADHPAKTRQSELLKLFPDAVLDDKGVCKICPNYVVRDYKCPPSARHCADCRHKFWLEEVK